MGQPIRKDDLEMISQINIRNVLNYQKKIIITGIIIYFFYSYF